MATKGELMRSSLPWEAATMLGNDITLSATAAGTVQGDALALVASMTVFTTVGSGAGAILPSATGVGTYSVYNGGSNALAVYPATGEIINGSSANSSFSVTNGKSATFIAHGNRWIANLSA